MTTTFTLHPATVADLDALADILVVSHKADATISNLMRGVAHTAEVGFYADEFRSVFEHEKGVKFFKIVEEESGKIVTMTCWHTPSVKSSLDHWGAPPDGANLSLCEDFFGKLEHLEKKWFKELGGGEEIYYLYFISTLPSYQGLGLGKMAMEGMLKVADASGKKTLLVGTPQAARTLYPKLGFKEVEAFEVDIKSQGIEGDGVWKVMVRDPASVI